MCYEASGSGDGGIAEGQSEASECCCRRYVRTGQINDIGVCVAIESIVPAKWSIACV